MPKPKRTFDADVGQKSTGVAGPDQIEYDLDNFAAMFDPLDVLRDGTPGGLTVENFRDGELEASAQAQVDLHESKQDNPHGVTAQQTGALVALNSISNPGGSIELFAGPGIAITADAALKRINVVATGDAIPVPHANEHAAGGIDELTPAMIGALSSTHVVDTMPHRFTSNGVVYKYGWQVDAATGALFFVYEEVI